MAQHNDRQSEKASAWQDAELVARAQAGEALAFEVIVRRHNRLMFRAARGLVSDDASAQDMVQEAYLRAFTHLDTFRGEASLRTWLTRIVINQCMSHLRSQKTVVSLDDDANVLHITNSEEDVMSLHFVAQDTPDASADNQQVKALLQDAISHLPETYRSVFMLRDVEDMSIEDTAYCLNVSRDVVKTRLLRARAMLRQRLASQLGSWTHATFEFAGLRCDAVTQHVMNELDQRGLIRPH